MLLFTMFWSLMIPMSYYLLCFVLVLSYVIANMCSHLTQFFFVLAGPNLIIQHSAQLATGGPNH